VPFHWCRTVLFLIPAIAVYSIVLGALSIFSSLFDGSGRFAHGCARLWAWLILATTGVEVGVQGRERVPRGAACIFISNHQSIYDIPVIFWHLPVQLRIIAKDSLGHFPVWGWHLRRTGHVLVDRRQPGAVTLRKVAALLQQGVSLIVFPEGTRSPDGQVARFKGGVFLLAIESGMPIVPLSIDGTRHVMTKGRLMTRPGVVNLVVHDPIATAGLPIEAAKELAARVEAIVAAGVGSSGPVERPVRAAPRRPRVPTAAAPDRGTQ
jgi:1-acyl-sn-glycerol-3-phosphate acyltransferase